MTLRRGRPLVVVVLSAMMGTMAGCGGSEDEPGVDQPSTVTPSEASPSMASAVQRSKRAFIDSVIGLRATGYTPTFGYTQYSICSDDGAQWRASANGRLEAGAPAGSTRGDAETVRDELTSVGWTPYDTDTSPEGIRELSSHWIVTVERGDLTINVSLYEDQPYILMRVLGPCLPATSAERREYETAGDQRFAVPGAGDESP